MDTPGLGSLARRGSAETLAYLPSCDLALVLIDAGMTLNEEDIGTLRLLYEAGIQLSCCSAKRTYWRKRIYWVTNYIREHLLRELGLDISVRAVTHNQTSRFSSINSLSAKCFRDSISHEVLGITPLRERSERCVSPWRLHSAQRSTRGNVEGTIFQRVCVAWRRNCAL